MLPPVLATTGTLAEPYSPSKVNVKTVGLFGSVETSVFHLTNGSPDKTPSAFALPPLPVCAPEPVVLTTLQLPRPNDQWLNDLVLLPVSR